MVFKKLQVQSACYRVEDADELTELMVDALDVTSAKRTRGKYGFCCSFVTFLAVKQNKGQTNLLITCLRALALCHNVTPVMDETTGERTYQVIYFLLNF